MLAAANRPGLRARMAPSLWALVAATTQIRPRSAARRPLARDFCRAFGQTQDMDMAGPMPNEAWYEIRDPEGELLKTVAAKIVGGRVSASCRHFPRGSQANRALHALVGRGADHQGRRGSEGAAKPVVLGGRRDGLRGPLRRKWHGNESSRPIPIGDSQNSRNPSARDLKSIARDLIAQPKIAAQGLNWSGICHRLENC